MSLRFSPANPDFLAQSAAAAAPELLGLLLCMNPAPGAILVARIVEVEAYTQDDPASHSFRGPSPRNRVMFGPPRLAYVYLIYGMHHCLNIVTGDPGVGEAILLRAAEPLAGIEVMWANRRPVDPSGPLDAQPPESSRKRDRLLSGPGNLCRGFGIRKELHNATPLTGGGPIALAREVTVQDRLGEPKRCFTASRPQRIVSTPRIGISKAQERLWRFVDGESRSLSRPIREALDRNSKTND